MLVESFLSYLRLERRYSEYTVMSYKTDLVEFKFFFVSQDKELSWETIDSDLIRQWMVSMMDSGFAASSVNRKLSALRSFYKYLLRKRHVRINPAAKIQGPKKEKKLPVFIKEKDMNFLIDDVDFGEGFKGCRNKMIIELFYTTGIRLSELVGLNDDDIDFVAGRIKVTGKRNKQRFIPFGEELSRSLSSYINIRNETFSGICMPALFVNMKGVRISRGGVADLVRKNLSKVVTIKKRSPHVLRHSFATSMLNNHAELNVVKELLGHESLAATQIYTHTTFEELKQVYKLAHPRA